MNCLRWSINLFNVRYFLFHKIFRKFATSIWWLTMKHYKVPHWSGKFSEYFHVNFNFRYAKNKAYYNYSNDLRINIATLIFSLQCHNILVFYMVFFWFFNVLCKNTIKHHVELVTHYIKVMNIWIKIMSKLPENIIASLKYNFNHSFEWLLSHWPWQYFIYTFSRELTVMFWKNYKIQNKIQW